MDFGSGYCEEDNQMGKGKLPFSYSSSSSPSSSSSQYKTQQLVPPLTNNSTNTWEPQIYDHQQMGSWLGNKYDPDEDNDGAAAASKLDIMEVSDDVRERDSDAGRSATSVHIEKEHMFDKVVTPSDVGKLNRLVIPKQHAEKYFPLDSSTNDKGLLLNFEDRNGKPWRFRYSYWNSSQSYVMTKGWSRFVKEKKLDAGDIVSFQRGVGELGKDRLYIDWRRRPDAPDSTSFHPPHHYSFHRSVPWSPLLMRPPPATARDHLHFPQQLNTNFNRSSYYGGAYNYSGNVVNPCSMGSVFYLRSPQQQIGMGMVEWQQQQQQQHQRQHYQQQQHQQQLPMVYESVPVVQGKAAAKRLRLFGVNMECPISESDECDILSSNAISHATIQPSQVTQLSSSSQSHLQLRLYNGTPLPALPPHDFLNKGKASMSLDLDI